MRDGWIDTVLGELAEITTGSRAKGGAITSGIPSIGGEQIAEDRSIKFNKMKFIPKDHFETMRTGKLKLGDSLLVKDGATTGKVGYWGYDIPAAVNEHVFILRAKPDCAEPYFINLLISHRPFREEIESRTRGIIGGITRDIENIELVVPPLPEQKRIVDLISSVDSYIEALQQLLESAKRSRSAVLHDLLTTGSDDWEYKILSDICEVRDGTHDSPKPSDEGFALVTSKNIKDGRLDLESAYLISPQDYEEVNKRSKVEQYNLLISMIGTIGEVIVVEGEPDFAIKNVGLLKSTEPILSRYLCHYLGSQLGKNAISLSVSGSTQKFISLGKLRVLPVLYPPMEDQKVIVEAMSLFDQQISKNLEVAVRMKNLRSSLLSDLLSGEHEIPVSYDKIIGAA